MKVPKKGKEVQFKKVPTLVKGFKVLELLANSRIPLRVTDIANLLGFNKSTVFNIVHTLLDLGFLDSLPPRHQGFFRNRHEDSLDSRFPRKSPLGASSRPPTRSTAFLDRSQSLYYEIFDHPPTVETGNSKNQKRPFCL
jgi:hypothetical protein